MANYEAQTAHPYHGGNGFHWRDGWYFRRLENGTVHVEHVAPPDRGLKEPDMQFDIPPNEWASIVAAVSAQGETGETYKASTELHG